MDAITERKGCSVTAPTKPGQPCRVIGSRSAFNGEGRGPNQDKTVTTMFLHDAKAGIEQENVWHCSAEPGQTLTTYYGAGPEADLLECWLEVIDPEAPAPKVAERETEMHS